MYGHVGGNTRENLVSRDEETFLCAPQARVLGRVTISTHDSPQASADFDLVAIADAAKRVRQFVDAPTKATKARFVGLEKILAVACRLVEAQTFRGRLESGVGREISAHQVLGA